MSTETIALIIAFASVIAVGALLIYVTRNAPGVSDANTADMSAQFIELGTKLAGDQAVVTEKFRQLDTKLASVQISLNKSEGAIDEKMGHIGTQVSGIVSLFSNDRARGSWGELALERIFEVAGLVEGRDYKSQFNEGEGRPDAVVFLPGDQTIVIDSKFPTARYLEAMAEPDADRRTAALVAHGKELEAVGKSLVKKHYADNSSAGYVIVFVPSQAVYEAAAEAHPEVIDRLMAQSVIVAGPVNVFALIKTAGSLLAEHRAVKDAREIVAEVRDLRSRLGVFAGHMGKVGKGLTSASKAFNSAIGSWNSRLSPTVNRIAEMSGADQLGHLDEVTEAVGASAPNTLKEVS